MQTIEWLEKWYTETCDGNWEHFCGITITTLDNPGWRVQIDLRGTHYSDMKMTEIKQDNGGNNWIICTIKDGIFQGAGDNMKLNEIISAFQKCVQSQKEFEEG